VLLQRTFRHDQYARRTVAHLAGVAGRDHPVGTDCLQFGQRFQAGIGADAFVAIVAPSIAFFVESVDDDDLAVESTANRGGSRFAVARQCEGVEFLAAKPMDLRHHLGAGELAELLDPVAALDRLRPWTDADARLHRQDHRGSHRHPRHAFHPGGDYHILGAAHHCLRSEVQGLLGATALPVDADRGNAVGQVGRHDHVAADVEALLADLANAADDHIFDHGGIDSALHDQCIEHGRAEIRWVPFAQRPAAPPARGAQRLDYIGFGHQLPPVSVDQARTNIPALASVRAVPLSIKAHSPGLRSPSGASIGSSWTSRISEGSSGDSPAHQATPKCGPPTSTRLWLPTLVSSAWLWGLGRTTS